jgi:Ser/Thr protein kinase RdoA (MazF antagonist)
MRDGPPVTDAEIVKALIDCYYGGQVRRGQVRRLHDSPREQQMAFLIRLPGSPAWVLRAARSGSPGGDHLCGCAADGQRELAHSRMATLLRLEDLGDPAPRAVRARDGELIAEVNGWCVQATSYIDGTVIRPTPDQLRLLGAALGTLHGLSPAGPAPAPDRSCWHTEAATPATRRLLDAARPLLPPDLRGLHAAFADATDAIAASAPCLPEAITHADAWPRNCIQTAPGQVTLIDWDTGGLGLAILDLGRALLECHLDSSLPDGDPGAWHIQPDQQRITALCQGYRSQRAPESAELALLADAIGFSIAFIGAIHLHQALNLGITGPGMDARLARLRNRLAASGEIAHIAQRQLRAADIS